MTIENVLNISKEDRKAIKAMRSKSEEEIYQDILIFKDWLKKQNHLPQHLSDGTLAEILHHCKYSFEKAKRKLDAYFSLPHVFPEYFQDRSALNPRIQESMKNTICVFLPKYTPKYGRVSIFKEMLPTTDHLAKMIVILMMADLRVNSDTFAADHIIADFENLSLSLALSLNPILMYNLFTILEKGYMPTIGGIHILNLPPFGLTVLNAVKSSLKPKYVSKIHLHKHYTELYEFFPKSMLPSDYEGEEKSLSELQDDWINYMIENESWFQNKTVRYSDESLRIGPGLENDLLGIQGTFRKLTVD